MTRTERLARWRDRWEAFIAPKLADVAMEAQRSPDYRVGCQLNVRVYVTIQRNPTVIQFFKFPDGWRYRPDVVVCDYPIWAARPFYKARRRVQNLMDWRPIPTH